MPAVNRPDVSQEINVELDGKIYYAKYTNRSAEPSACDYGINYYCWQNEIEGLILVERTTGLIKGMDFETDLSLSEGEILTIKNSGPFKEEAVRLASQFIDTDDYILTESDRSYTYPSDMGAITRTSYTVTFRKYIKTSSGEEIPTSDQVSIKFGLFGSYGFISFDDIGRYDDLDDITVDEAQIRSAIVERMKEKYDLDRGKYTVTDEYLASGVDGKLLWHAAVYSQNKRIFKEIVIEI